MTLVLQIARPRRMAASVKGAKQRTTFTASVHAGLLLVEITTIINRKHYLPGYIIIRT